MEVSSCRYDPSKLPSLQISTGKKRTIDILLHRPVVQPIKLEDKQYQKRYEDVLVNNQLKTNNTSAKPVSPTNNKFQIEPIFNKDEESIEHLYNVKLLLTSVIGFLNAQRALLLKLLYNIDKSYIKDIVCFRAIDEFESASSHFKQDFRLLCEHCDIPNLYYKYVGGELKKDFEYAQYKQEVWRHPFFTDKVSPRDELRTIQIDDEFSDKRPFRIRQPYEYTKIIFDIHYKQRFLNGCDTSYNYEDVMLKSATQPIPPIDRIQDRDLLTPLPRIQNVLYLFRPSSQDKLTYEEIMLRCYQPLKSPHRLTIREYVQKQQRIVNNLKSEIYRACITLVKQLRKIDNTKFKELYESHSFLTTRPLLSNIVILGEDKSITLTDFSSWMRVALIDKTSHPLTIIENTSHLGPFSSEKDEVDVNTESFAENRTECLLTDNSLTRVDADIEESLAENRTE